MAEVIGCSRCSPWVPESGELFTEMLPCTLALLHHEKQLPQVSSTTVSPSRGCRPVGHALHEENLFHLVYVKSTLGLA